ncbi:MAG TPA: SRPBCC family protein [Acidimicrobiales bacterium]
MTDESLADPAADTASVHVAAPPQAVWEVVSHPERLPEWSPECTGIRWYGARKGAEVGAKFLGFNRKGRLRWLTRNRVEVVEPGKAFGWLTIDNRTRWTYRIDPAGDGDDAGSTVTLSRELPEQRPALAKFLVQRFMGGVDAHDAHMRQNIRQSLERLKTVIERD